MEESDKRYRELERLELRRAAINQRFESHKARINARIDQKQARLSGKLNLKQERIIDAALELLSSGGLDNLSLREIAKRLNLQAPALYWYFNSKSTLVDFMAEAILQKGFANLQPRQQNEAWQDWLIAHMQQLRKAMLAYPDGGRVVAGAHIYPAVTLAKSFEYSLVSLSSAGIDLQTAQHIALTATHYTFGYVIEEQAAPTPEELAKFDLKTFLKPYPHIAAVVKEAPLSQNNIDENFTIGLQYIIKGSGASHNSQ